MKSLRGGGFGGGDLPLPRYTQDLNAQPSRFPCKQSTTLVVVGLVAAIFITVQIVAFFEFSTSSSNQHDMHPQMRSHRSQSQFPPPSPPSPKQRLQQEQQAAEDNAQDEGQRGAQGIPEAASRKDVGGEASRRDKVAIVEMVERGKDQEVGREKEEEELGGGEGAEGDQAEGVVSREREGEAEEEEEEEKEKSQQQGGAHGGVRCMAGGREIDVPATSVNDDFCDCNDDGADEPSTAACEGVREKGFMCPVEQQRIPTSRVGDGVCDCCNGADEAMRADITCTDACDAFRRRAKEQQDRTAQGRRVYASYLREGQNARKSALEDAEGSSAVAWGPSDAFYPLTKRCYERTQGQYRFKLCPFHSAEQIDTKQGGARGTHRLGSKPNFDRLQSEGVVVLEGGAACPDIGPRKTEVHFSCAPEDALARVTEPQKCVYLFDFETPAACGA